jgi:hypothetical protein
MEQKFQADKNEIAMDNQHREIIMEQDRQYLEQEKQRQNERAKKLFQVTVTNKEVRKEYILEKKHYNIFSYFS